MNSLLAGDASRSDSQTTRCHNQGKGSGEHIEGRLAKLRKNGSRVQLAVRPGYGAFQMGHKGCTVEGHGTVESLGSGKAQTLLGLFYPVFHLRRWPKPPMNLH